MKSKEKKNGSYKKEKRKERPRIRSKDQEKT